MKKAKRWVLCVYFYMKNKLYLISTTSLWRLWGGIEISHNWSLLICHFSSWWENYVLAPSLPRARLHSTVGIHANFPTHNFIKLFLMTLSRSPFTVINFALRKKPSWSEPNHLHYTWKHFFLVEHFIRRQRQHDDDN